MLDYFQQINNKGNLGKSRFLYQAYVLNFYVKDCYGGILLPPTCKINYVNMQHNNVNRRLIYVDMHHNYVDMHVINFCQKLFFYTG